jgi:hypothetical protein
MSYVLSGVHAASRSGKAEKVLEFLSKGTDVNKPDVSGCTPAMWACWGGHVDLLGVLCEHGADLECANSVGTRAIHWACWSGSVEVLKALLKKGVNIDVCDEQDGAPLHYVAKKGVPELCTLLLKAGASVDVRSSSSMTPLHVACHSNRKDVARMLIFKRADVNAVDKGGRTPLHYACLKNHTTIVRLLLDWKADAQALDARGKSPETLVGQSACRKDKPLGEEVLAMLKEANRHSAETAPKSAEKDSNPKPAEDGPVGPKEEEQVPEVATRNEESLTPAAATGTPDNAAKYQKKRSVKNLLGALMGSGSGSGDSFMRSSPRRLSSSSISVPEGVETEVPLQQLSQPAGRKRKGSAASAGASASLREIHVNASEEDVALQPSSSKLSVSPRLNGSLGSPLSYSSALMEPVASDDEGDDNDDQEVAFEMAIEKVRKGGSVELQVTLHECLLMGSFNRR